MSAIGAAVGKVVGLGGGPQITAALLVGGLVIGGAAGGFIASRPGGSQGTAGAQLEIYPCPDQGPAIAKVSSGQQMLVTGKTADGAWLRIFFPAPGRTEGWVQAQALKLDSSADALPVGECEPVTAAVGSVAPGQTLTAIENNTPSPSPTPVPTATPNAKPALSGFKASTGKISYDTGSYCPTAATKVTFTVTAKDDHGVDGVALFWRAPGAASYAQVPMTQATGDATSGTWQVTLDTKADGITTAGKLAYYAVATDVGGETGRTPASGASTITVAVCANTGPDDHVSQVLVGLFVVLGPAGVGSCAISTSITAKVDDIDGVKSVTLFYLRPGDSTWSSKSMTGRSGTWAAALNTATDKITIPTPPTGSLKWYIKAVDGKNVASQTKTASITIRRCDTEAQFDGVFPTNQFYACTTTTMTIGTYANDADQPADGLTVTFFWSLVNPRTGDGPVSGKMNASVKNGNYYEGTTSTFNGKTFYAGSLTVYAITTDRYGGTTQSPTHSPYTMSCK